MTYLLASLPLWLWIAYVRRRDLADFADGFLCIPVEIYRRARFTLTGGR